MTIKLFVDPGSGSVRRVTTAAKIMGVQLEEIFVDLFKGESHTPDFLKLNPHGLVPVLVDGDTVIYEASAINIYLAEKTGSDLLPKAGAERYEVLQWMFWSGEQFRINAATLFEERIGKRVQGQPENATVSDHMTAKLRAAAAVLDQHLASRRFIAGDRLTLADIDIAAPFSQAHRTGLPLNEFPNLVAWQQRLLAEVPAWAETKTALDQRVDPALDYLGISFSEADYYAKAA